MHASESRRHFLSTLGCGTLGTVAFSPVVGELLQAAEEAGQPAPHVATNTYPWTTFARRAKQPFKIHSDELLADIARTGITGYEPIISNPAEFDGLDDRLKAHGLEMRSLYVNSDLHLADKAEKSIASVMAIAEAARKTVGTRIIVTNPSPIRWGGPENKSDAELRQQANSLDRLGAQLRSIGVSLAYHNHDAELRAGGREFHHMLTATNPENVKFCLDAHWVFRGCGNSEVAVFDALTHYHDRIIELHLRQSVGGVWTEEFRMQGDIDYSRMFKFLAEQNIIPHFVLEQAVEEKSPNERNAAAAHAASRKNLIAAIS